MKCQVKRGFKDGRQRCPKQSDDLEKKSEIIEYFSDFEEEKSFQLTKMKQ